MCHGMSRNKEHLNNLPTWMLRRHGMPTHANYLLDNMNTGTESNVTFVQSPASVNSAQRVICTEPSVSQLRPMCHMHRAKQQSMHRARRQSTHRGRRQSTHRARRQSTHRARRQSTHRGRRQSTHKGRRQSTHRGKRQSTHRARRQSTHRARRQSTRE